MAGWQAGLWQGLMAGWQAGNAFKSVFWLNPFVSWISRRAKICIPYIPCRSLLLSTTVLNDNQALIHIADAQIIQALM